MVKSIGKSDVPQEAKETLKALKHLKAPYSGTPVKPGTEYVDHSLLVGDKANIEMHLRKLEKYLEQNPNDIEVRTQVARLRELLKKL